jgi:hypothetical protein
MSFLLRHHPSQPSSPKVFDFEEKVMILPENVFIPTRKG